MPQTFTVLQSLADCLCNNIQQASGVGLCWCGVYPGGAPTWEHCGGCEGDLCGMGYVSLGGASLYNVFGQALVTPTKCDAFTQLTVTMGVLRCIPVPEDGTLTLPDVMSEVAAQLALDMDAIRQAATCCHKGDVILASYDALPAAGGCVGGQWTLIVDAG